MHVSRHIVIPFAHLCSNHTPHHTPSHLTPHHPLTHQSEHMGGSLYDLVVEEDHKELKMNMANIEAETVSRRTEGISIAYCMCMCICVQ